MASLSCFLALVMDTFSSIFQIIAQMSMKIYGDYLPAKDAHHKAHIGHRHRPFEYTSTELF